MTIKTIFLDRDGVINKEVKYLHNIEDCIFINGIFESCRYFQKLGYQIIVITNQSGIHRGYYSDNDFQILTEWMLDQFTQKGVNLLDFFYCPHGPKSNCKCRKPQPGMLLEAKAKHNIDMEHSWMIGDNEIDIIAANKAGINNTILLKTDYKFSQSSSNAKIILDSLLQTKQAITS